MTARCAHFGGSFGETRAAATPFGPENHGAFALLTALALVRRPRVGRRAVCADEGGHTPKFAYGLPGGNNILGEFDPLNLLEGKSKLEVYKYREAELTHGRVAMLASLGFLVQEKFHPLFSGDTDIAINQVPQLPIWLWAGMLAGIAGAEQTRIAKGWQKLDQRSYTASESLREGYMPGDLGFDPFKIKPQDPEKLLDMQEKELSHGRLAMIAAMGFLAQETVTGQTWGAFWGDASF